MFIWGLIDQAGSNFVSMRTYVSSSGYAPPGLFQVSITGLGRLEAYAGWDRIASLHNQELRRDQLDVLWSRPVLNALSPVLHIVAKGIQSTGVMLTEGEVLQEAAAAVVETLSRILRRIQSFRHGGCILITPTTKYMRIKYRLAYRRIRDAIVHTTTRQLAEDMEYRRFRLMPREEMISAEALIKHRSAVVQTEDARSEREGAEWFVSLLTRVDGAVVLSPELVVLGYGAEITANRAPGRLWQAHDLNGIKKHARMADYEHFGTRHRSAMRYCAVAPRALALVVSQDGDVRVVANVVGRTTVWENVKLGSEEFVVTDEPVISPTA